MEQCNPPALYCRMPGNYISPENWSAEVNNSLCLPLHIFFHVCLSYELNGFSLVGGE